VHGHGPAVVIVPGTLRDAQNYRAMAGHLADSHTVYVLNRRGRGGSGDKGRDYSVTTEGDDLAAVLSRSGPALVFGHSYGGFIALENAHRLGIEHIAVYEPALSIAGSIRADWLPEFEHALAKGHSARAMALALRRISGGGIIGRIPVVVLSAMVAGMMRSPEGRGVADLLPTMPSEVREVSRHSSDGRRYAGVARRLLILNGARGPRYARDACEVLASVNPGCTTVTVPNVGHNAPDMDDPATIAAEVRRFLPAASGQPS
jgi:pimeloyl-ACP methyl ester carboxylesterase